MTGPIVESRLPAPAGWDCPQTRACLSGTWPIVYNVATGNISLAAVVTGLRSHTRIIATSNAANPSYDPIRCDVLVTGVGDAAAINGEIANMAAAGGGILYLAEGTYILEASIMLANNILIEGAGANTILTTTAAGYHVIQSGASANVGVRKLQIQANQGAGFAGMYYAGATNAYVDEVLFDCDESGVLLDTSTRVIVSHCTATATAVNGFYAIDCADIVFHDNTSLAAGVNAFGIYIETCARFALIDNVVQDSTLGGIFVSGGSQAVLVANRLYNIPLVAFWGAIRVDACEESEIVANEVIDCGGNGIDIVNHQSTVCASNVVIRSEDRAIILNTGSRSMVIGNIVDDPGNDGIFLLNSNSCRVSDNHVFEAGQDGINLESSDYNTVDGNVIRANGVTLNGINVFNAACDLNLILNNDLYTAGTVANYVNAGTNTQERSNRIDADPVTHSGWYSAKPRTATRIVAANNSSDDWWGHGYADYYCDGVADEVEINAAITYVNAAGGGSVFLSEGTFIISGPINMLDGVWVIGTEQTTIQLLAGVNNSPNAMIMSAGPTGHIGLLYLTIDGNRGNGSITEGVHLTDSPYSYVNGLYIMETQAPGAFAPPGSGFVIDNCDYSIVMNNWVYHCGSAFSVLNPDAGLKALNSIGCIFANNIVQSCYLANFLFDGCTYSSISGNISENSSNNGYTIYNCTGCTISRNVSNICVAFGIAVTLSDHNTIAMNTIDQSTTAGIWLNSSDDNLIADNLVYRTGAGGIGIDIGGNYNLITGNHIRHNPATPAALGISVGPVSTGNVCEGNDLYQSGTVDYRDLGTGTMERDNRVTEGWYSLRVKPLQQTGTWYGGDWESSSTASQPVAQDTMYALPIRIPLLHQYQNIGVDITLGDGAGGVARLGIYDDLNGWPNALLEDCGVISTNAIAVQTRPVTITIPGSIVWLVYLGDHGNPPNLRCHDNRYSVTTSLIGLAAVNSVVSNGGVIVAQAYGALPATFPGGGAIGNIASYYFPRILLQY